MNLQQISYIIGYPSVVFPLTFCRLQSYWRSIRADDFGSIYDEKTFTQMQFEFYNTLPIEAWPYYQLDLIQEIKYTSRACNDEITVYYHADRKSVAVVQLDPNNYLALMLFLCMLTRNMSQSTINHKPEQCCFSLGML